jgi:hypothetical protein
MRRLHLSLASLVIALASVSSASATTLSFGLCVSNNSTADCGIATAQLAVSVAAGPGAGQVAFTFTNVGASASSITDVYFDDGTLLGIASIGNGAGVSFSQGASPGNLPAGNNATPPFVATSGFTADSDPPAQPNGVNPGETLTIVFDLQGGGTLADVLAELGDGRLRIGVHVQGFASGGSESLVNTPLPEPALLALLGVGLVGLARAGRRRS